MSWNDIPKSLRVMQELGLTLQQWQALMAGRPLNYFDCKLTSDDLERMARHRGELPGIPKGYEEHGSYPINIELPECTQCGELAVYCPCPAKYTAPFGTPWTKPHPKRDPIEEMKERLGITDADTKGSATLLPMIPAPSANIPMEIYTDGSGTLADQLCAIGVVAVVGGTIVAETAECIGWGSNNVCELRSIGRALAIAHAYGGSREAPVVICADSLYAINAARGTYEVKAHPALVALAMQIQAEVKRWPRLSFKHVRGHDGNAHNERADHLAGLARKQAVARPERPPFVVLDLETTGASPEYHHVLEIAAARANGATLAVEDRFHARILLPPGASRQPEAMATHGYDPDSKAWKAEAKPLGEVLRAFAAWLPAGGRFGHMGHNAGFDARMTEGAFRRAKLPVPSLGTATIDTMEYAARLVKSKTIANKKLATLCDHFGIPNAGAHEAGRDVDRCLACFANIRKADLFGKVGAHV